MTPPDLDLTTPKPGRPPLLDRALALDRRLFEAAAARHWPGRTPSCPG